MAYIEKTAFEPRITNNEFNELCNITGRYQVSDADADCSAGLLVVRGEQLPCAGFKGIKNENAFYMTAAGAAANADTGVYACNTYEWPMLGGRNGNNYAVGTATLGLGVPAGRDGTFTEIVFDGKHAYRFGEGNLSTAIGANTIFTIANGLLVPAAAAPHYYRCHLLQAEGHRQLYRGRRAELRVLRRVGLQGQHRDRVTREESE